MARVSMLGDAIQHGPQVYGIQGRLHLKALPEAPPSADRLSQDTRGIMKLKVFKALAATAIAGAIA